MQEYRRRLETMRRLRDELGASMGYDPIDRKLRGGLVMVDPSVRRLKRSVAGRVKPRRAHQEGRGIVGRVRKNML